MITEEKLQELSENIYDALSGHYQAHPTVELNSLHIRTDLYNALLRSIVSEETLEAMDEDMIMAIMGVPVVAVDMEQEFELVMAD